MDFDSPAWPVCTVSYRAFHLQWTLPVCLALYLLNRPFLTRLDYAKLTLLPIIAFVWTTPWDNLIIKNHAWFYRRHCVWFTIGYVPIEEYFFFVIQSIMTTLWCSFVTRWQLPNLYVSRQHTCKDRWTLATPAVVTATCAFAAGLWLAQPGTGSYYFGMITWWSAVPLGLLLWGTIDFLVAMGLRAGIVPYLISVAAPTVYLCCSDIYALRRGTWHINESTSLNIFPYKDLPIEEMLFFIVTNTILVTACYTFDRCVAICRTDTSHRSVLSPSYLPLNTLTTYQQLWSAFIRADHDLDQGSSKASDLRLSLHVLQKASKSFSAASLLLPWDLRTDLGCLYAFCRVADDLVDDDTLKMASKLESLETIHKVVEAIYQATSKEREADTRSRVTQVLATASIDKEVQASVCAAACSIAPLTQFIPKRLWLEMLSGYRMDLNFEHPDPTARTRIQNMEDLFEYSQCVAGVVGEMCTRVILARSGVHVDTELKVNRTIKMPSTIDESITQALNLADREDLHTLLYEARRMGVSLQLVNIARDIIPDSLELGRCYLPRELFSAADHAMQDLLSQKRVRLPSDQPSKAGVRPESVRKYSLRLLDISKQLYRQSFPALDQIPNPPARAGLRAACSVYAAIGTRIEAQTSAEVATGNRARLSHFDRLCRALSAVYLGS